MTWDKFKEYYLDNVEMDFSIDISKVNFTETWFNNFSKRFTRAHKAMEELEAGVIANPDENRMVGHYWLRNSDIAPDIKIKSEIEETISAIKSFSKKINKGKIKGQKGKFKNLLLVGIGGSALGPQLVDHALSPSKQGLKTFFLDNTDPDGIDRILKKLKDDLGKTLVVVISKSGGTKETRNGMLEVQNAYKKAKVKFAPHAVAVTGENSNLFLTAQKGKWLDIFPMWDWVGGRTSVMSAVGLLPAALQGYDISQFLQGAKEMDEWTREPNLANNPAGLLAAMWFSTGTGKGKKDMVVLPYKDRLELFSKYLQQLVMESLGKEKDLKGKIVHQGLAVYGNKGSTDQHAYIQQLRDGLNNFFATFIEVKKSRSGKSIEVDPCMSTGDYLEGFFLGTRQALTESGRESITVTIGEVSERSLGQLIALFERAVGFYAALIGINAYHQPGVEAGKKAAQNILDLKIKLLECLSSLEKPATATTIASKMKCRDQVETIFKLLNFLNSNTGSKVNCVSRKGVSSTFSMEDK
jgi:glucose-6-phosphate isomerase